MSLDRRRSCESNKSRFQCRAVGKPGSREGGGDQLQRHWVRRATLQEDSARTPGRDSAGIVKGNHPKGAEVWDSSPTLGIVHDGSHAEYGRDRSSLHYGVGVCSDAAQIQAGETILILGAAGAVVGQAAMQTANWKKARVIGADITSDPIAQYRGVTHETPRAAVEIRTPSPE